MSSSNTLLHGKKVVIIGGSSGIGRAVAAGSLANGASVVIGSSTQNKVDAAVELLKKGIKGKADETLSGDVVNIGNFEVLNGFLTKHAPFDHLVITAGGSPGKGPDLASPPTDLKDVYGALVDSRYWAALNAANIIHKNNLARPGGSITFTTGILAQRPQPGVGNFIGVAGAIEVAMRALAIDHKPLRVNTIAPGLIDTEFVQGMPDAVRDGASESVKKQPISRIGTPEEAAEAYIFAMKCGYLTGQVITVDGGGVLA